MRRRIAALLLLAAAGCFTPPAPVPPPAPSHATAADEAAVLAGCNRIRGARGLAPLVADPRLGRAAYGHAVFLSARRWIAHDGIGDGTMQSRIADQGYPAGAMAEDLAMGQPTAAALVAAWESDPAHLVNILGPYRDAGVGVARDSDGLAYWVVDLGSPLP